MACVHLVLFVYISYYCIHVFMCLIVPFGLLYCTIQQFRAGFYTILYHFVLLCSNVFNRIVLM